ncbi:MAG TPA: hypothetical protein VLL08_31380 [Kineosporiaceae bacterium]|nr:hypothetical protein [Kineosporiaceae bacterium]
MIRAFHFDETDVVVVVRGLQLEALHGWAPGPDVDLDEIFGWADLARVGDWRPRPYGRDVRLRAASSAR